MEEKKKKTTNKNPRLSGCPMIVNYLNTFALGIKILCLEFASCVLSAQPEGRGRQEEQWMVSGRKFGDVVAALGLG